MKTFLSRWLIWIILAAIEVVLLVLYPPFRLVDLEEARFERELATFNPQTFAEDFWENRLFPSLDLADPAAEVLNTLLQDRNAAREQYGHVVGLGGPHHFFVRGEGRVTAINKRSIELNLYEDASGEADVIIQTALIFGNQVLNATGLIQRSQFPRTNDYNEVSAAVNQIVEQRVIPPFIEGLEVGDFIGFVGCSDEVIDDGPLPIPLKLIPVEVRRQ